MYKAPLVAFMHMGSLICLVSLQHLSSRLARLAVEENLCHSFQAFHSAYSDTGLLGIHFVADRHYIEDMMHWSQNAWSVSPVCVGDTHTHTHTLNASLVCCWQDEPLHHGDGERRRQGQERSEGQPGCTAEWCEMHLLFVCFLNNTRTLSPTSQHCWLSPPCRNDSHLRRHRQAHPQLRPPYPASWVGRSHRREFTLSLLSSSAVFCFLLWPSLRLTTSRLLPPRWCGKSAPSISMISVLLLQLLVSCCSFLLVVWLQLLCVATFCVCVRVYVCLSVWFHFNLQHVCFSSLCQVLSSSCLTTTECAVLCTGWGFKDNRLPPPDRRRQTALLPVITLRGGSGLLGPTAHPSSPCLRPLSGPALWVSSQGGSMYSHCEAFKWHIGSILTVWCRYHHLGWFYIYRLSLFSINEKESTDVWPLYQLNAVQPEWNVSR